MLGYPDIYEAKPRAESYRLQGRFVQVCGECGDSGEMGKTGVAWDLLHIKLRV